MKKVILILIVFLLALKPTIAQVTIVNIQPEIICKGDSTNVCFTLDFVPPPSTPFNVVIYFRSDESPTGTITIFQGILSDLVSADTLDTGEPIYCRWFKIPAWFQSGQWCASGTIPSQFVYCIWVNDCGVQVPELNQDCVKPIYSVLYGPVLIEQKGTVRRKVILIE